MNKGTKILVADDEPGIRDLLTYELESRGAKVTAVGDGEQLIEAVKKEKFQLIISDIKMPKVDGLEALESVKASDPGLEVIIMTGFGTVESAVSAIKKGAYDFVQKPFHLNEVMTLIDKALENKELKTLVGVYEASKLVFTTMKLDVLLPTILKICRNLLDADDASIMLMEQDKHLHVVAVEADKDNDERKQARLAIGERVAGKAAQLKEPLLLVGPLSDDPRFSGVTSLRQVKSSVVYPLMVKGDVLGILNISRLNKSDPFNMNDMHAISVFCAHMAQAIQNAKLYEEVEDRARQLKEAYDQLQQAQKQLIQSEKFAAIGRLAGGVAHELNNPLTGILGFSQLLLQETGLNPQQKEDIESIFKQSQRCRKIIQNLLLFSQRREPQKTRVNVGSLLEETVEGMRDEMKTLGIRVLRDIPKTLPLVPIDIDQIQQAFLILLGRARQSIEVKKPENGRIDLKVSQNDGHMVLTFQDNGCGLAPGLEGDILDPFVNLSSGGRGMDLELSTVYTILQQHEGALRAENGPIEGALFTLKLPLH